MSDKETPEEQVANKEKGVQGVVNEQPLTEEQATKKEPIKSSKTPPPVVSGDDKITIQKHDFCYKSGKGDARVATGAEIQVVNATDAPIGSTLFEAIFYNEAGNTLDTIMHRTIDLHPNVSRTLRITPSPKVCNIKSYKVRVLKTVTIPKTTVTGNERLIILKHNFLDPNNDPGEEHPAEVELAIRNVSESTIATAVFEATFYDIEGNIVDTVKHEEVDLKQGYSRAFLVKSRIQQKSKVKSYNINIIRTATTDVEKVQLRRQEIITTETGEKEVTVIVKNISDIRTDAAVVATLYSPGNESIGTKVVILRDIEPNTIRQYQFKFKPQEGDRVGRCTLHIGDLVE